MNVPAKFEVRSFLPAFLKKKLWAVPGLDTPFKVIQGLDIGTNRKRVYDFVLVSNSIYLAPFRRYCSFCALE